MGSFIKVGLSRCCMAVPLIRFACMVVCLRFCFRTRAQRRLSFKPVLFNIYHAAVMLDFRSRRKEAASAGQMDEGIDWVAQVDGGLFRPRFDRKRGRCQLRTVLGDVEFV